RVLPKIAPPPADRVEVRGLLAPPPAAGLALGSGIQHQDDAWLVTRVDLDVLARDVLDPSPGGPAALAPRVLRLDPALPLGYARDLDVLPNTLPPARHLVYAVQWFAFALVALVIFVALHWRKVEK